MVFSWFLIEIACFPDGHVGIALQVATWFLIQKGMQLNHRTPKMVCNKIIVS